MASRLIPSKIPMLLVLVVVFGFVLGEVMCVIARYSAG
jgi:hypothetical protein